MCRKHLSAHQPLLCISTRVFCIFSAFRSCPDILLLKASRSFCFQSSRVFFYFPSFICKNIIIFYYLVLFSFLLCSCAFLTNFSVLRKTKPPFPKGSGGSCSGSVVTADRHPEMGPDSYIRSLLLSDRAGNNQGRHTGTD